MENTKREIKELGLMMGDLIENIFGSVLRTLSAIVLVGRLIGKPIEVVIAILRDMESVAEGVKKKTRREVEP